MEVASWPTRQRTGGGIEHPSPGGVPARRVREHGVDTFAKEVMVPRTEIIFIERTKTLRQAMSLGLRSGFSRIPVIGENLDDVVGIVYLKDLARRSFEHRDAEHTERVERIMRPVTFVPDSKPADELMREMQASRIHAAIVIDEYGGTAGVVTLSGILSELLGVDFAMFQEGYKPAIRKTGGNSSIISGEMQIDDFNLTFNENLASKESETIGGYIIERLGYFPAKDEFIETGKYVLRVRRVEKKRIHSIEVLTGGGR